MPNMLDYVAWRGDLSFSKSSLNKIDMLIMSQLVMIDLDNIVSSNNETITIEEAAHKYFAPDSGKKMEIGLIIPKTILELFKVVSTTKRFKKIELSNYVNIVDENKEEQMSAMVYKIDDNNICVAYSGTDDTIIGWKENINMMFKSPIPAQISALKYLEKVAEEFKGNIAICGHSKGGNLSLYTTTYINDEIQRRIIKAYNFDGPGFCEVIDIKEELLNKMKKVITIIPQGSIVGRLFEHKEKNIIVKSTQNGFYQHDAFSWEIIGKDFVKEEEITKDSENIDKKIKSIIKEMNEEERINFSDNLYKILSAGDSKNLLEVNKRKMMVVEAFWKLSKEEKKSITGPIRLLLKDKYFRKIVFASIRSFKDYNN